MTKKKQVKRAPLPNSGAANYPPLSDNRYKGLIYWWTFSELRANPEQIDRRVNRW